MTDGWTQRLTVAAGSAAFVVAAGFGVAQVSGASAAPMATPAPAPAPTGSGVNSRGLSYGSSADGDSNLVRVLGKTGKTGFVYKTDLNRSDPTSPADAGAQEEAERAGWTIPVYDVEGATVIDSFFVGGLDSTVEGPTPSETASSTTSPTSPTLRPRRVQ